MSFRLMPSRSEGRGSSVGSAGTSIVALVMAWYIVATAILNFMVGLLVSCCFCIFELLAYKPNDRSRSNDFFDFSVIPLYC